VAAISTRSAVARATAISGKQVRARYSVAPAIRQEQSSKARSAPAQPGASVGVSTLPARPSAPAEAGEGLAGCARNTGYPILLVHLMTPAATGGRAVA
jgi:hypothetical protein